VDRDIKVTPAPREPSKDKREPTPRDKSSIKEERREPTKEREKEKRRDKRPSPSGEFDGDLSSVSNSSNGSSMPTSGDVIVVDDPRGELKLILKIKFKRV
jgi:hypothetical protein